MTLDDMVREFSEPNWDGYDAVPVDPLAVINARLLLGSIGDRWMLPEICPDNDGCVSLDWFNGNILSVSVNGKGGLAYAWLSGADSGNGTAKFSGEMPEEIAALMNRLGFLRFMSEATERAHVRVAR